MQAVNGLLLRVYTPTHAFFMMLRDAFVRGIVVRRCAGWQSYPAHLLTTTYYRRPTCGSGNLESRLLPTPGILSGRDS